MPFRQAHQVVGELVAKAEKQNLELQNLPLEQLKAASQVIEKDVYTLARREKRRRPVHQPRLGRDEDIQG